MNKEKAYKLINTSRKRYGTLKKCEFHIHTPASYDYKLIGEKSYKDLEIDEILDVAFSENYLPIETINEIKRNISDYQGDKYESNLKEINRPFANFKEYLAYMLIAHKLYAEEIQVAVISDHNTIKGFKKLRFALNEYFKERIKGKEDNRHAIHLFLGVEITCSEQNHLIAIFEEYKYEQVESYLREIIISERGGTYFTTDHIITEVNEKFKGLTYIAHVNSSDLYGSGLYNKKLFSSPYLKVLGLTQLNYKAKMFEVLKSKKYHKEPERKFGFIYEGDSHHIFAIGLRNTWIKFSDISFSSLKKAFQNHSINIYVEKPNKSDRFIKGIVVVPGNKGFLQSSNPIEDYLCLDFSRDLNCIIGGRGTGKSTILNIIETILTLEVDNLNKLVFISRHKRIYLSIFLDESDYLIEFIPQIKDGVHYIGGMFLENAFDTNSQKGKIRLSDNWVNLYKIEDGIFTKVPKSNKQEIFHSFYRRGYSINKIVNMIENGEIGEFIRDVILFGTKTQSIEMYLNNLSKKHPKFFASYLRDNLGRIIKTLETRKELVNDILENYNEQSSHLLKIIYSPKPLRISDYLNELLEKITSNQKSFSTTNSHKAELSKKHVANTYLTWHEVSRYLLQISEKIGYLKFLQLLFGKKYRNLDSYLPINTFVDKQNLTFLDVENTLNDISPENISEVYDSIQRKLTQNRMEFERSIKNWIEMEDEFTLEFNVNSKESFQREKIHLKNISELSLGQKVVAILTFVFNYGYYINDTSPLIIDQPEDNLDNQYIFKNLVESLRQLKNARQVILVTHSSTIVTNSDTEQVVVMESDQNKAWVTSKGYPTDGTITKHIINYLEGGFESFRHKMETYTTLIKDFSKEN